LFSFRHRRSCLV